MAKQIKTPPAREPVSLALAKSHLRVDGTDDDNLISGLIVAARRWCENYQNRTYMEQTWELWLDDFPAEDYIEIPLPPLQSITSIKYYDTDDTEATVTATDYIVDATGFIGRVVLADGKSWPTTSLRPAKGVCIEFVCGYAAYSTVVNTVATAVSKTSGDSFVTSWAVNKLVDIAGTTYRLAAVTSTDALTLAATAGNLTGATLTTDDVPEDIRAAILLLIGHLYENREAGAERALSEIPFGVKALLSMDRVVPI